LAKQGGFDYPTTAIVKSPFPMLLLREPREQEGDLVPGRRGTHGAAALGLQAHDPRFSGGLRGESGGSLH